MKLLLTKFAVLSVLAVLAAALFGAEAPHRGAALFAGAAIIVFAMLPGEAVTEECSATAFAAKLNTLLQQETQSLVGRGRQ